MSHNLATAQAILSALTDVQEQFHGAVQAEDYDRAAEMADIVAEQTNRMAMQALAHATVALAEQQRIANLIALGTYRIDADRPPLFRDLVVETVGEYAVRPAEALREGLGL